MRCEFEGMNTQLNARDVLLQLRVFEGRRLPAAWDDFFRDPILLVRFPMASICLQRIAPLLVPAALCVRELTAMMDFTARSLGCLLPLPYFTYAAQQPVLRNLSRCGTVQRHVV